MIRKVLKFLWKTYNFFVLILGHMVVILALAAYCYHLYTENVFYWIFVVAAVFMVLFCIVANIYHKITKKIMPDDTVKKEKSPESMEYEKAANELKERVKANKPLRKVWNT